MGPKRPYFQMIDGVERCPNLNPAVFKQGLTFRACQGDVLLSSYPVAGGKWVQYITKTENSKTRRTDRHLRSVRSRSPRPRPHQRPKWKSPLPMRLFSTGMPLRPDTMNPEAKYVCVVRNPWDSCVSFFHRVNELSVYRFQDGTFDEFFDSFFLEDSFGLETYIDVVAEGYALKDEPNVFFVTYEELHKDARTVVLKLARFLGERYAKALEGDASMLQNILGLCTAEHMKDVMVSTMRQKADGSAVSCRSGYRGDKSKYCIVRNARVGEWKEYMTPHHLRRLDAKIRQAEDKAACMKLWENIRADVGGVSAKLPK